MSSTPPTADLFEMFRERDMEGGAKHATEIGAVVPAYNGYGVEVINREPGAYGRKYLTSYQVVGARLKKKL